MFARELIFIEDLERSELGVSEGTGVSYVVEASGLIIDLFNDLLNLLALFVLAFFVNIPQYFKLLLGWILSVDSHKFSFFFVYSNYLKRY